MSDDLRGPGIWCEHSSPSAGRPDVEAPLIVWEYAFALERIIDDTQARLLNTENALLGATAFKNAVAYEAGTSLQKEIIAARDERGGCEQDEPARTRSEAARRGWATAKIPPWRERELQEEALDMRTAGKTLDEIARLQGIGRDKASSRVRKATSGSAATKDTP